MTNRLVEHSRQVERLRSTLEHHYETRGDDHRRSLTAISRVGAGALHRGGEA